MPTHFDIAIVGSGFAGSLFAMIARRLGRSVILLERHRHPRFAIGESSTPLANLLLEQLATQHNLPRLLPLTKWGAWQRSYPQITCGLKRGFTFYHHTDGHPFSGRADRSDQLLVAASPHDGIADTHWYRADFDELLVQEAQSLGVKYRDEFVLESVDALPGNVTLQGSRQGKSLVIRARWLIDATGNDGSLAKSLGITRHSHEGFPATQSLFTHFTGVQDCARLSPPEPPYPPGAAAVHHVFDGGWVWSLAFNNGITSAGVMATPALARDLQLAEGEPAWHRLLHRFPTLRSLFCAARPVRPFTYAPAVAFRANHVTGSGWTLLASAAGFVDPLLSTGFPLALLGIQRLAAIFEQDWGTDRFAARLDAYAASTLAELDATALLVRCLYLNFGDFRRFVPLTLLYFAAASYAEMARRLGRPELAGGFLLHDHPAFGPAFRQCCARVIAEAELSRPEGMSDLAADVRRAIEPIDVAGLGRSDRGNWYPVNAADTIAAAGKLGVDAGAMALMLRRCEL